MLNNVQVWLSTPTALLPQPPCNPLYTGIVYTALDWNNQQNAPVHNYTKCGITTYVCQVGSKAVASNFDVVRPGSGCGHNIIIHVYGGSRASLHVSS